MPWSNSRALQQLKTIFCSKTKKIVTWTVWSLFILKWLWKPFNNLITVSQRPAATYGLCSDILCCCKNVKMQNKRIFLWFFTHFNVGKTCSTETVSFTGLWSHALQQHIDDIGVAAIHLKPTDIKILSISVQGLCEHLLIPSSVMLPCHQLQVI